jgi:hypothetical protein
MASPAGLPTPAHASPRPSSDRGAAVASPSVVATAPIQRPDALSAPGLHHEQRAGTVRERQVGGSPSSTGPEPEPDLAHQAKKGRLDTPTVTARRETFAARLRATLPASLQPDVDRIVTGVVDKWNAATKDNYLQKISVFTDWLAARGDASSRAIT